MAAGRWGRLLERHLGGEWPAAQLVDALFRAVLLRPVDPASQRFYVRALGRGLPVADIVRAVHTSPEAVANSWRAPVSAGLGPELWSRTGAPAPPRQLYVAGPPAGVPTDGSGLAAARAGAEGPGRPALHDLDLDQLVWVPAVVRRHAGVVSGPLGRVGRQLVSPTARAVLVVARPDRAGGSAQARCLATHIDPGRAWLDHSPLEEAARRGLDQTRPLQSLIEAGPEGAGPEDLERAALEALAGFDQVVVDGPPATASGSGPDWALYRAALDIAGGRP